MMAKEYLYFLENKKEIAFRLKDLDQNVLEGACKVWIDNTPVAQIMEKYYPEGPARDSFNKALQCQSTIESQ